MTNSPAIGRTIKRLFHEDRPALIRMLSLVPPTIWRNYAHAWLLALGATDETTISETTPGILFVWAQLVREYNNAQHNPDQSIEGSQGTAQTDQQR